MIRCPNPECRVSWKIPFTNDYCLLVNKNQNKFHVVKEPIQLTSYFHEIKDLNELADKMGELNIEFINADGISCPKCNHIHSFAEWVDTWEDPMKYYDISALCSCGGELWWDKIPGTTKFAHVCDDCGWAKPRAIISGAE